VSNSICPKIRADEDCGFRVVPHTPELTEALEAHEAIMAEYDGVFRELAK
jgi:hypothetical protein